MYSLKDDRKERNIYIAYLKKVGTDKILPLSDHTNSFFSSILEILYTTSDYTKICISIYCELKEEAGEPQRKGTHLVIYFAVTGES